MGVRKLVERLTKPTEDLDREKLIEFCAALECKKTDELVPRAHNKVAGEVQSVRVVPRAGSPTLEVSLSDGHGQVVGIFFGRRKLAGLIPGRRLMLEGVVAPVGNRNVMYNPVYELLG